MPTLASLGSDESLGGALLTPIAWLKPERAVADGMSEPQAHSLGALHGQGNGQQAGNGNELKSEETEMVEGPNGVGRIETVSVINGVLSTVSQSGNGSSPQTSPTRARSGDGAAASVEESLREAGAVTQGELIRLEQEAGVVPVSVASRSPQRPRMPVGAGDMEGSPQSDSEMVDDGEGDDEAKEETPHARGPEEIGAEDVGPGQERLGSPGVLDMERAVGRNLPHGEATGSADQASSKDAEMADTQVAGPDVDMEDKEKAEASEAVPDAEADSKDETN